MNGPDWVNRFGMFLLLGGVVLLAHGIGWLCRRFVPGWWRVLVAVVLGGGWGFVAGGMVVSGFTYPARLDFLLLLPACFFGVVGALQAGFTAVEAKGTTNIEV